MSAATLFAAFAAALYARNAVLEARRAADIARDSDRAWMVFDSIEARRSIGPNGITSAINIWVRFSNAGNSPALKTTCFLQLDYVADEESIEGYKFAPINERDTGHSVIGPGKEVGPGYATIPMDAYYGAFRKEYFILIRSGVMYTDFYSKDRKIIENYFKFVPLHPPGLLFSEGDLPLSSHFIAIGNRSQAT